MTSRIDYNDPRAVGGFSLAYHREMLSDMKRVIPLLRAIDAHCRDQVVFESGTGSGVLSIMAARAGAKAVFCSEIDPAIAAFAKQNIASSGCADRIHLIEGSTLDVTPADLGGLAPQVMIAENLSTWQVTEPQNQVINHIRSTLAQPGAVSIPAITRNYLQLAQTEYTFFDTVKLSCHFFEFSGIRGPIQLSKPALFTEFDYGKINETAFDREITVTAWTAGTVNSLRLTSPIEYSDGNHFDWSDSLMPPVVVPLENSVTVRAGDGVTVSIRYQTNTRWEDMRCEARLA
ncbi:MAG TPA: 50S ribosomal protein L11 methyltransferase [Vicinamibacterales bacterium]